MLAEPGGADVEPPHRQRLDPPMRLNPTAGAELVDRVETD
jgi:hypothetical protein